MNKTGGPAFPFIELDAAGSVYQQHEGMTLRDYFAAKAMQGMIAYHGDKMHIVDSDGRTSLHFAAYDHADAMLKAREA